MIELREIEGETEKQTETDCMTELREIEGETEKQRERLTV